MEQVDVLLPRTHAEAPFITIEPYPDDLFHQDIIGRDFSYHVFDSARISQATYKDCSFKCSDFNYCNLSDIKFVNCDLTAVNFYRTSMYKIEFINCIKDEMAISGGNIDYDIIKNLGVVSKTKNLNQLNFRQYIEDSPIEEISDITFDCISSLQGTKFRSKILRNIKFKNIDFTGLSISFKGSDFHRCLFEDSTIAGDFSCTNWFETKIKNCKFNSHEIKKDCLYSKDLIFEGSNVHRFFPVNCPNRRIKSTRIS